MKSRLNGSTSAVLRPVLIAVLTQFPIAQALAAGSDAVTQDQFKAWTDWAKKSVEILDKREKKIEQTQATPSQPSSPSNSSNPSAAAGGEQAVDLSNPGLGTSQTTLSEPSLSEKSKTPHFEAYFDLNLVNEPGSTDSFAFDSYHNFLFVDLAPAPNLTFSFNLLGPQSMPIYYELDYQATKRLTLRAGKIWIPFDDISQISPHTIFGGRDSVTQLMPSATGNGGPTFLPTVWTELGVGAKYLLVDEKSLQVETHLCIVNGFSDGGTDPVTGNSGANAYPNFSAYTPSGSSIGGQIAGTDPSGNHRNKSVAMRAHALIENSFGVGVSYYTGQWNEDSDPNGHQDLSLFGTDLQFQLGKIELRAGFATMNVGLDSGNAHRGGSYFEVGIPLNDMWLIRARAGTLQLDSRVELPTDMTVLGGTLIYNPTGNIQASLESNRDVKDPGVAVGFKSYTDLRLIMLF